MGGDGSISATVHFAYRNNEVIQMDKQDKEMDELMILSMRRGYCTGGIKCNPQSKQKGLLCSSPYN